LSEKSVRVQRVERELHHLVAHYLQNDLAEPTPAMVSVTAVDVAGDLRKASVYFRLVGEDAEIKATEKILDINRKRVQAKVAKEIQLKFCPVLEFRYGKAGKIALSEEEENVERLLADLHRKKHQWD